MINREILYERNLTGSYMKIPVAVNAGFDEKIMLKRKLPGLLPVERCFINGHGQYWYNISGKQSLDTVCKLKTLGIDFIERMIVSICNEIDILQWNLMDEKCLVLDPELIFVTNQNGEIIFSVYPGAHDSLGKEFQHLMEYLITKIDHSDADAVHQAYSIYEKTFEEGYSVVDIRNIIINKKEQLPVEEMRKSIVEREPENILYGSNPTKRVKEKSEPEKNTVVKAISARTRIMDKLNVVNTTIAYWEKFKNKVKNHFIRDRSQFTENKWDLDEIEDFNIETETVYVSNPTVCLRNYTPNPKGVLLYDGGEGFENIVLDQSVTRVGKSHDVDAIIDRETVSGFHAKIQCENNEYYIEDLNSTNGTSINGDALNYKEKKLLKINDIVQFADLKYRFI